MSLVRAIALYPVIVVSPSRREGEEPMGTKRKFWWRDDEGRRWLFKYGREGTGEDWAEKIAAEIAGALGLPHAHVELAVCGAHLGTLSLDFTGETSALVHGNELLQRSSPLYPVDAEYGASEHTVAAVLDALARDRVDAPSGQAEPGLATASDWFMGYLMLDALLGNTDRHHENWAVLERESGGLRRVELGPSYDHASSLGRELSDTERTARLDGKDRRRTVAAYARRTRSALYRNAADARPLSPVLAFAEAAARSPGAARTWLARLDAVSDAVLASIMERVPADRMSEPARRFALVLMAENRSALRAALEPAR
jgi:hypothetical protein